MNCWIILLLLCCYGKNNSVNSCIQTGMYEKETFNVRRERDCDCDDHSHNHTQTYNDGCGCSGEERVREKWMPYSESNDNDRRDYHDSCRNERERSCDCK